MKYSPPSLQDLCLHTLIKYLEYYPHERLASLPPTLRRLLLANVPIVDLCQLEKTCVFDGVDAEAIWEQKCDDQVSRYFSFVINTAKCYNDGDIWYDDDCYHYPWPDCQPEMPKTNRQRYLDTILFAMLERAHPTGCFDCEANICLEEYPIMTLGDIDLVKYGLFDFPVDIVNYLVASVRLNLVEITREPFDETYDNPDEIDLDKPLTDFEIDIAPVEFDRSTYINVNKLCQYVPPRYSSYLNKENDYRLQEEDAIVLLMEKCNHYPEEISITLYRYSVIKWRWEQEKVRDIIGNLYGNSLKFELRCSNYYDHQVKKPTETLSEILPAITNDNCSLSIVDVKDKAIIALAPSLGQLNSPCVLKKLAIENLDDITAVTALGDVLTAQFKLSYLKINYLTLLQVAEKFTTAVENLFKNPDFQELSLDGHNVLMEMVARLIVAYLTSPCTQAQSFSLQAYFHDSPDISSHCISTVVPELALENKSLKVYTYPEIRLVHWLFSLQPLKLKSLDVTIARYQKNFDFLALAASNPTLAVHSLRLCNTTFSCEPFQTLMKNDSLRELEIELNQEVNLTDITSGLLKQNENGTLRMLKIAKFEDRSGGVKPQNISDIQEFGDTLFSLPQVSQFSLQFGIVFDQPADVSDLVESLFSSWKKKSKGCRLVTFVIDIYRFDKELLTPLTLNEHTQTLANEIGMKIQFETAVSESESESESESKSESESN